jgi:hypothetical protein
MGGTGSGGIGLGGAGSGGTGTGGLNAGGSGGAVQGGGSSGTGGASMGGAGGPAGAVAAAPFIGLWRGNARNGSIDYGVELALTEGAVGERFGIFFIPDFDCGGTVTLNSIGGNLVYREALLFDRRNQCGPAGTVTLIPTNMADRLDYRFYDGAKTDRGNLQRHAPLGSATPSLYVGLWESSIGPRQVLLAMVRGDSGQATGYIAYPRQNCAGFLTLRSVSSEEIVLDERVTTTGSGCTATATVRLRPQGANLDYTSVAPGSNFAHVLVRIR